ncbi:hypothetical protein HYT26_01430 [Candidatus Pacearchaeota archaeon]|nr:hypothetical protein [Candidatus Pacearchaeota archaeon]
MTDKERKEAEAKVLWLKPDSGTGFGLCAFAGQIIWNEQEPKKFNPETGRFDDDWASVVAVIGPKLKYFDWELEKIIPFAEKMTQEYDKHWRYRVGCNLIILEKREDGRWLRKRMSWIEGQMYSKSLDEAIKIFLQ